MHCYYHIFMLILKHLYDERKKYFTNKYTILNTKPMYKTLTLTGLLLAMLLSSNQMNAIIEANNDWYTVFSNTNTDLGITQNDTLSSGCTNPTIQILDDPLYTGTATVSGATIIYTPAAGQTTDILRYSIHCGDASETDTATVYIKILAKPEYISDIDCYTTPEPQDWIIGKADTIGLVRTVSQFLVGDMNNDGYPDIVALYGPYVAGDANPRKDPNQIKTFYGPDFTRVDSITGITPESQSFGAIGRIKVSDSPEKYENLIFYRDMPTAAELATWVPKPLHAVSPDGTFRWTSNTNCEKGMIGLADFNGDGWTEVYVGNKIFDAATGKLLAQGSGNSGKAALVTTYSNYVAHPQAVDILGDEDLELVTGNQIYKVEIDRTVTSPKTLQIISSVTPPSGAGNDGVTIVGDFNNDGKLEVLVRQRQGAATSGTRIYLYLWSPHINNGTILAQTNETPTPNSLGFFGIPFIGDIDGDGRIEIITLISGNTLSNSSGFRARKYDETASTSATAFVDFWNISHTDQSGSTGMTLFDFNLDGIAEIVYRDEKSLRIINGSKKSHITGADTIVYTLSSFKSYSETSLEYPIVVDIYNNGSSAILVTSDTGDTRSVPSQNNYTGQAYIDIFASDPVTPWAPARKVWNQYSYNPVNVNEDLTIPARPISIATTLPGNDGILGTADDVRPFNNVMQQQTMLNSNGTQLWLAADIIPDPSLQSILYTGDDVDITLGIVNIGAATFTNPLKYTIYKNSVNPTNIIGTYSENTPIFAGDTLPVTANISNISTFLPFNKLIIRVNDDGTTFPIHYECKTTNNELVYFPLLYNENNTYPSSGGTLPHPNPVLLLNLDEIGVAGNSGNLQRPATDSVMFVGWSPRDNCIYIEYPEDEPFDILFPRDTVQILNSNKNLYVVWAYDKNLNGIPDYLELQVRVIPVNQWPLTNPEWSRSYEAADASWYTTCEMDLVLTVQPSLVKDRVVRVNYLGALKKEYVTDLNGKQLPDTFIFKIGQGRIEQRFIINEIPADQEGKTGAIEGRLDGGRNDTTKWMALYNHPTYSSIQIKPYYDLNFKLRLDITGGSPNLLRSVNGLPWRNAYLPLNGAEQMETVEGEVLLREPNGCWEQKFYFIPPITPLIQRAVHIPEHSSVTTNPEPGDYYVLGHNDFSFTACYTGNPLQVTAVGFNTGDIIRLTGKQLDKGCYEYTFRQVTEPWTVSFGSETSTEIIEGLSVWTYKNTLYIRSETKASASIYTITGSLYKQIKISEGEQKELLPKGVYLLLFDNGKRHKIWID